MTARGLFVSLAALGATLFHLAGLGGCGGDGGGGSGTTTGSAGPCIPNAPCFAGPAGTRGVGACKAGTCDAHGVCQGAVTPDYEACGTGEDRDCDGSVAPACTPSTAHPRLWITPIDLPRLSSWATSANPVYQEAIAPLAKQADDTYSSEGAVDIYGQPLNTFFPPALGGAPNPKWPDDGGDGVGAYRVETYAQLLAFMSLISTEPQVKEAYAKKAKNLVLYAMKAAAACDQPSSSVPYCSLIFAYFNRSNYVGEAWGLTVDWIYPYLDAADKALIRKVFLKWADAIVHAVYFAPDLDYIKPPLDLSSSSNTQLLSNQWNGNNQRQFRWSANNYYSGSMRNLLLMTLAIDEADDPPVDPAAPADKLGNTMRSYLPYLYNVVQYQQYAMYEEREKVIEAYKLSSILSKVDGPGLASGGLPVEGFLYGHSLGYVLMAQLALHTAGRDDVSVHGPQAGLFASKYWDKVRDGFLGSLLPAPTATPSTYPYASVYQMASFGDLLYFYVTDWDHAPLFSTLALRHRAMSDDEGAKKALWALTSAMPGGPSYLTTSLSKVLTTSGASTAILAFMALDPAAPLASYADPRPNQPLTVVDPTIARIVSRTGTDPQASLFDHICSWESINHQQGNCGQFELYRKGEWLTAERHAYDNSVYDSSGHVTQLPYAYTPEYHNTLSLQNDLSNLDLSTLGDDEKANAERGGQWNNGANAGDPTTRVSAGDDLPYAYAQDVMTNLYNRVFNHAYDTPQTRATAIKHASRSLLWIKPDHVVTYDRAESGPQDATAADLPLFKRYNLILVPKPGPAPSITQNEGGYVTQSVTKGGQSLFVQTLLPAGVAPKVLPSDPIHPAAQMDQGGIRFRVESPTAKEVRFLHVLQGADAGQAQDPVRLVQSTAGTAFAGATIARSAGTALVLFLADLSELGAFKSTTATTPAGLKDLYVLDLEPETTYYVNAGAQISVGTTPGGTAVTTDAAGALHLSF